MDQEGNNCGVVKRSSNTKTSKKLDEAITNVAHLQRLVVVEIVKKQNELRLNACTTSEEENGECDTTQFNQFLEKEWNKCVAETEIISKKKVKRAFKLLRTKSKKRKQKLSTEAQRYELLKKHCSKHSASVTWWEEAEHTWHSPMFIVNKIRACILSRNWNTLTQLLLMLLTHHKSYIAYIKQVGLLGILNNPLRYNGELLKEFQQLHVASSRK